MRILGKIIKFLGNFIGVILSLVLSLALLVMLVATPMLSGLSTFTRPETIRQVVQDIDFAAIFTESFTGEMSEEERKSAEAIIQMTETKAFGDLIELYATDLTNAFDGEAKPSVLTEEALRKIMNDNMDELVALLRQIGESMGEDSSDYTDAEIEEKVRELFDEVVGRFLELAPTADDLRKLMVKISEEFTTDSSTDDERPNSGMEFVEDAYDTPSYEFDEDDANGDSTVTYIPGDGTFIVGPDGMIQSGDGTITTIIVGPDGTIQSGDGAFSYYYVDPETGAIVFEGGKGGSATAIGGSFTYGKAVAIQNGVIRVLLMSIGPSVGEQPAEGQENIADEVLKLAKMAKNGTLTLALVGVMVVFALLICLFRWPRFKGLMWVAVMLLIGAVFVALAGVAYTYLPGMIAGKGGAETSVLTAAAPVIKIIANSMFVAAAIYAGVAIVLIVLFVLFRKALRKQKAAKAEAVARAAAIEEIAVEAEEAASETCEEVPVEEITETEEMPVEAEEIPTEDTAISEVEEESTALEEETSEEEEITAE